MIQNERMDNVKKMARCKISNNNNIDFQATRWLWNLSGQLVVDIAL